MSVDADFEIADMKRRLADLEAEISVYRQNGLRDLFTGHGFQEFGAGVMRIDNSGMQIKSNDTLAPERAAIWFLEEFRTTSPGSTYPYGAIYGLNQSGIGQTYIQHDTYRSATEYAYSAEGIAAGNATWGARVRDGSLQVESSLILRNRSSNSLPYSLALNLGGAEQEMGGVLDYEHSAGVTTVSNTTTETAILSYSVPASLLSTSRGLQATIGGTYLNNDGAARNLTIRVKFGTTTMWAATVSLSNSATERGWRAQVEMFNAGATNDQRMSGFVSIGPAAGPTTGTGGWVNTSSAPHLFGTIAGSAAEDTTAAKTFSITVKHGTASNNLSITRTVGVLELL